MLVMTIGAFQANERKKVVHLPADAPQRGDGAVAHLHVLLAMRLRNASKVKRRAHLLTNSNSN